MMIVANLGIVITSFQIKSRRRGIFSLWDILCVARVFVCLFGDESSVACIRFNLNRHSLLMNAPSQPFFRVSGENDRMINVLANLQTVS